MSNQEDKITSTSLFLRLLGGGYLVYLAWDLRGGAQENPLFLIAAIVFGLIGAGLFGHSLLTMIREGHFRKDAISELDTTEDCEERSDD